MKDIDIMKVCNHENIIKYIDYFEDLEYIYIITEYAKIGNLQDYLGNNFNMNETTVKEIIQQIAKAISYLHSNFIIHRNVNLKNILVCEENNKMIFKIYKFSSSKLINTHELDCKKISNVCYMPPEVFLNNIYNTKSDVWSLGIILYYLLFQKLPFISESDNYFEIYSKISNAEYIYDKKVSKYMDELLKGCFVKNFGDRYSINDFLSKLKSL
jgi:serine/threonine protein kinase